MTLAAAEDYRRSCRLVVEARSRPPAHLLTMKIGTGYLFNAENCSIFSYKMPPESSSVRSKRRQAFKLHDR